MRKQFAKTFAGLSLLTLVACSDDNEVNIIIAEDGSTEETNAAIFDMWNGDQGMYQVETGRDAGEGKSGYWFSFADDADGGASQITYPVNPGNEYSDNELAPVIDICGGLCGTITLDAGSLNASPFAGIGFNIAGDNNEPANVSDWGGICVAYSADDDMSIEMDLGALDISLKYDLPKVQLPATIERTDKCFSWSEFKQSGVSSISGEDAAKQLVALLFKMYGTSGTTSTFNIMAVGTHAAYTKPVPKKSITSSSASVITTTSSSSSNTNKNPSVSTITRYIFDMWNGYDMQYQVDTGIDDGTGTSGYWYTYSDDPEGGASKIDYPITWTYDDFTHALDPIIDFCEGLCGTITLDKGSLVEDPFAGIAFEVSGEKSVGDASKWGGICFAYISDLPFTVKMGLGEVVDKSLAYDLPQVNINASAEETPLCFVWSDFKQTNSNTMSGEQAAKQLKNIKFNFGGKDKTTGKFNIKGLGSYVGGVKTEEIPASSSSIFNFTSSSSRGIPANSSSSATQTPNYRPTQYDFDMWDAKAGVYQVDTYLDNGNATSGYWYAYGDESNGGKSTLTYPVEIGNEYDDAALDNVINHCFGICGTIALDKGSANEPFYYLAFDVAGLNDSQTQREAADATALKGICFAYQSQLDFTVELGLLPNVEESINYDIPKVQLNASAGESTPCFTWDDFKQDNSSTLSGAEAAKQLVSIRFRFTGESGTEGNFNIKGFGSYREMIQFFIK